MTADTPITVVQPPELDTTPEQELPRETLADLLADPLVCRVGLAVAVLRAWEMMVTPSTVAAVAKIDESDAEVVLSRIESAVAVPDSDVPGSDMLMDRYREDPDPEAGTWYHVVYRDGSERFAGAVRTVLVPDGLAGMANEFEELEKGGDVPLGWVETAADCTELDVRHAVRAKLNLHVNEVWDYACHHANNDSDVYQAALVYASWQTFAVGNLGDKPTIRDICKLTCLRRDTVKKAVRWYRRFGQV